MSAKRDGIHLNLHDSPFFDQITILPLRLSLQLIPPDHQFPVNQTVTSLTCTPPSFFLRCKGKIAPCIDNPLPGFCTPVVIIPQFIYARKKRHHYTYKLMNASTPSFTGKNRTRLVVFLGSAGPATKAIIQTHHLAEDFRDKLDQAMTSTTDSFESLQGQMNSLAGAVLQNRRALDVITADTHRGTCLALGRNGSM